MSTAPSEPPEEASALPRLTRRGWILVAAGLAALTGAVSWYALTVAAAPVRWKDVGFTVESPTAVSVTYDVYLYSDSDAECTVRALNPRFAEVGVTAVRVAAADGPEQRLTTTIVTTEEATTALVDACVAVD